MHLSRCGGHISPKEIVAYFWSGSEISERQKGLQYAFEKYHTITGHWSNDNENEYNIEASRGLPLESLVHSCSGWTYYGATVFLPQGKLIYCIIWRQVSVRTSYSFRHLMCLAYLLVSCTLCKHTASSAFWQTGSKACPALPHRNQGSNLSPMTLDTREIMGGAPIALFRKAFNFDSLIYSI